MVRQQCKLLRIPAGAAQCVRLAEEVVRAKQNHLGYLEELLAAELEERERNTVQRRIHDARLPRMKTPEEFDFTQSPKISPGQRRKAAVVLTTNLPFSELTQVIFNARLCKALIEHITDRAHVIETGAESYSAEQCQSKGGGEMPR